MSKESPESKITSVKKFPESNLISEREVAKALHVSYRTIRKWRYDKKMPLKPIRLGRQLYFKFNEVVDWGEEKGFWATGEENDAKDLLGSDKKRT